MAGAPSKHEIHPNIIYDVPYDTPKVVDGNPASLYTIPMSKYATEIYDYNDQLLFTIVQPALWSEQVENICNGYAGYANVQCYPRRTYRVED